jgi:hypothetical protein
MRINDTPNNSPEAHSMRERESQDIQDAKTNCPPIPVEEHADTLETFVRDNGAWLDGLMRRKEGRR